MQKTFLKKFYKPQQIEFSSSIRFKKQRPNFLSPIRIMSSSIHQYRIMSSSIHQYRIMSQQKSITMTSQSEKIAKFIRKIKKNK